MGTRSNIGKMQDDGTIKAIYCHWDGYPEGVGAILAEHYQELDKVEELLSLGDFSSIKENISEIESYASRGESGTEARTFNNLEEWKEWASDCGCEYLYLYQKDWHERYQWSWLSIYNTWHILPAKLTV